jgi:hypothetical protein
MATFDVSHDGSVFHPTDTPLEITVIDGIHFSISRVGGPVLLVTQDGRRLASKAPGKVLRYKLEINWGVFGQLRPFSFFEVDCVGKQFVNVASILNLGWYTNEVEDDEKRLTLTTLLGNPAKLIDDVCKQLVCQTPKGIVSAYKDVPFSYKTPSKEPFSEYAKYPYEELTDEIPGFDTSNLPSANKPSLAVEADAEVST